MAISHVGVRTALCQIPGLPVLQNAWATPGVMIAADFGGGRSRQAIAAAASWSPLDRLQLSAGVGLQSGRSVGWSAAYGIRLAVPLVPPSSPVGVSVFAGLGGASSATDIPAGLGIGWQRRNASGRGISVYATPALVYFGGGPKPANLWRVGLGADIGLTPLWGVTGGIDFGKDRQSGVGGPTGIRVGAGVSRALGRRSP